MPVPSLVEGHDIRPYLPELFEKPGSMLYIGARPDACAWLREMCDVGHTITVIEVWPENVAAMMDSDLPVSVVCSDVGTVACVVTDIVAAYCPGAWDFDYVMWWHGPEHVPKEFVEMILHGLECMTTRTIALAAPWGVYQQAAHEGNPHEEHLWSVYPEDLEVLGYQVATDGQPDRHGSEIVAWKRLSHS